MYSNTQYLHALRCLPSVDVKTVDRLCRYFVDSAAAAWEAPLQTLVRAGVTPRRARKIVTERKQHSVDLAWADRLRYPDITLVTQDDPTYPDCLRQIAQPPRLLYCWGAVELLQHDRLVAWVGARKASSYGLQVVTQYVPPLVRAGAVIVSGLAFGIDAASHQATLDAGGQTIAVLGSGVCARDIMPSRNQQLGKTIVAKGGLLVSEYPPGSLVFAAQFPERNRIIAGLSRSTIVVEAGENSGSLITARFALESGRDVCTVPGQITSPQSAGSNQLLLQGACPIVDLVSLEAAVGFNLTTTQTEPINLSTLDANIYKTLHANGSQTIDQLSLAINAPIHRILSSLTSLQIKGVIAKDISGAYTVRN